jgi:hypothetical protein
MWRSWRLRYLLALLAVAALGLTTRTVSVGWHVWDKSLGDVLYAIGAYLVLRFLVPRAAPRWAALVAAAFCLSIELFKFTGLPAAWASSRGSRLLFGTTPSWHNVICYAIGVTVVALADVAITPGKTGCDGCPDE